MKSFYALLWIFLIGLITMQLEQPITVKPADTDGFSAINAMDHINVMASEAHFIGTKENRKVKNYILDEFAKLNIPTEVFVSHSKRQWGDGYIRMARTENIIATIKGRSSKKAVLVAGHYDSVISAPGAADDVHAVACMLEVAKHLHQKELENDIIFLITDGEELGLFGAKAFADQRDLSKIGVVLNYEARGNSGGSISFEWSDGNAWLVKEMRKVAKRPLATSMSYEIYKNLPNDTDFTMFKEAGLSGINHGFIDGFSYYHNPDDTPENINQKSVQHTGENMLRLTQHFANTDLSVTKTINASFFNLFGFLIIYPSSLDIFFLIAILVFLFFTIYKAFRRKSITVKSIAIGLGGALSVILLSAAFSFGLSKLLFTLYPHYDVFYAGQFYNHKWYLITAIGVTIFISAIITNRYKSDSRIAGIKGAFLIVMGIICVLVYLYIPTASYFVLFPTAALIGFYYYNLIKEPTQEKGSIPYLFSVLPMAMWIPVVPLFFLAFSIVGLPGPVILVALICLASYILFDSLWKDSALLKYAGLGIIILSLLVAHLLSKPTANNPLPSSLIYNYNVDSQEAKFATLDNRLNIGNEEMLKGAAYSEFSRPRQGRYWNVDTNVKPHCAIPSIMKDTSIAGAFSIISNEDIYLTRFYIEDRINVQSMYLNDQEVFTNLDSESSISIDAYGFIADTLRVRITRVDENIELTLRINSNVKSLPIEDKISDNALRVDGFTDIVQEVRL